MADFITLTQNSIEEDPLSPSEHSPRATSVPISNERVHKVYTPLPRSLCRRTFPKLLQNRLIWLSWTHRATLINSTVNSTTLDIDCYGTVPGKLEEMCFLWSMFLSPNSFPLEPEIQGRIPCYLHSTRLGMTCFLPRSFLPKLAEKLMNGVV
jgi:hypothetical protein